MLIDVTDLDKILLLQTLYLHADPKGYGERQYAKDLRDGKAVEGLSVRECNLLIQNAVVEYGYTDVVDYHNGKPIKLAWSLNAGNRMEAHTLSYDSCHGRFRFLEAVLNVFDIEEIRILDKEYDPIQDKLFIAKLEERPVEAQIKNILDEAVYHSDVNGSLYWKLEGNAANNYRSSLLDGLDD